MNADHATDEAVEILQQFGLKEYEARCFVGLSRLSAGTAKDLSNVTEVPRTRVYDAIRVLEAKGLVEIQHTSPQQYRAVSVDEAIETLRRRYDARCERLGDTLDAVGEISDPTGDAESGHEVWTLSDATAIDERTQRLVDGAEAETALVLGCESALTEGLERSLNDLCDDVDLCVGAVDEDLRRRVAERVPTETTFEPETDWLSRECEDVLITRLVLVDGTTILVSTRDRRAGTEFAVFGSGFTNGFVVLARRLLCLNLPVRDTTTPAEGR